MPTVLRNLCRLKISGPRIYGTRGRISGRLSTSGSGMGGDEMLSSGAGVSKFCEVIVRPRISIGRSSAHSPADTSLPKASGR